MQFRFLGVALFLFMILFASIGAGESSKPGKPGKPLLNIKYAGVRSSIYGIRPFPKPEVWGKAIQLIRNKFPVSTPHAIWIVGTQENEYTCRLEFPGNGKLYKNIVFGREDRHEAYLSYFDRQGIKVFLQVEPLHADVPTLIDLVLSRYEHHPSVIGFGVDVEWYRRAERKDWGIPVDDATAQKWEGRVKMYNPSYRLFLKHWNRNRMPVTYRGDIVFVSDSQRLENLDEMVEEFSNYWAAYFAPNPVYFQIGYPSDKKWWKKLADPIFDIGTAVAEKVNQECGIFWVDFTLREVSFMNYSEIYKQGIYKK